MIISSNMQLLIETNIDFSDPRHGMTPKNKFIMIVFGPMMNYFFKIGLSPVWVGFLFLFFVSLFSYYIPCFQYILDRDKGKTKWKRIGAWYRDIESKLYFWGTLFALIMLLFISLFTQIGMSYHGDWLWFPKYVNGTVGK